MAKAPTVFSKTKCAITGKGCFVARTVVATICGSKAIEDIEVGDKVLASDPETGETAYKQVLNTYIYVKDTLVYVTIDGETIETTKEHPFWVEGQGWTKAKFLETGDQLRDANGNTITIDNVKIVKLPENKYTFVYNFEVADFHTYFVSECIVLVHNSCKNTDNSYYHVTTKENAQKIIESGQLGTKNNSWEARVFAWTEQPTKKQASIAGIGKDANTVVKFNTNASFELDAGNKNKSISNIVVQTTDGQRVPISISNAEVVGFKKRWWQFWKK